MNPTEKELQALLNDQRANMTYHIPSEQEFVYYRQVAQGDMSILEYMRDAKPFEGMGVLSKDPLRNAKYHLIILIAMLTRVCIDAGLPGEEAYTLSDMFIRQADVCTSIEELSVIKYNMTTQFTTTMHERNKRNANSLPVMRSMEYIETRLTEPVTPADVAEHVGLNADYLSRLFVRESGVTLGRYILERKCATACYMLRNSNVSCTDIAAFLGFASCSYFIERFKSVKGMTPAQFRKNHGGKSLGDLFEQN